MLSTISTHFIVKDAVKSIAFRLLDGIEPEILSELKHAPLHIDGVQAVKGMRARWIGHKIYADVQIAVSGDLSVADAQNLATKVEDSLREHERMLGQVVVRAVPAQHRHTITH